MQSERLKAKVKYLKEKGKQMPQVDEDLEKELKKVEALSEWYQEYCRLESFVFGAHTQF